MESLNGKFTLVTLWWYLVWIVVLGRYSYIAQSVSWGLIEVKANVKVMAYMLIMS